MSEPIVSPIDGQVAHHFDYLELDAATAVVERAHAAQREWKHSSIADRVALCMKALEHFEAKGEQYAREITTMMGKPLGEAQGEARTMRGRVEALCALAPAALADEALLELTGIRRFIRQEPVGVVLDIAAWNYPLLVPINVVSGAVLAGDAVLLKLAPQTALCGRALGDSF
ncbi:MAG: aldehyde dehydrogenase family protein, partial [Myxococcales bacterium]|nr:aldehyde dehydrogenase family protein [Myxococcales bacterium]